MPAYIPCENFPNCDVAVARWGDKCDECKRREAAERSRRWMWAGWTRYEENDRVRNGHKGKKDDK